MPDVSEVALSEEAGPEKAEDLAARLHQCQQALAASEARFRSTIENNADGIIVVGGDGRVRFVNPAAERMLGRSSEDLLGQPFGFPVVAGETIEIDILRPEGEIAVAEMRVADTVWEGELAYLASLRDITVRVTMESRLRFQAQLLDSVRESVVATDLDGRVLYWGKGAEALYGHAAEEVLGRDIVELLVPPDEAEAERARIAHVIEHGAWRGQYQQCCKDGTLFWADTVISLVRDENGEPSGLIGIDRDITERRRANKALRREVAERQRAESQMRYQADVNAAMAELARSLLSTTYLEDVSELVLDHAKRFTGSTFGYVGYIDPQTGHLVCPTMTKGIWDACQVPDKSIVFESFGGLWGWVLEHRQSIVVNDLAADPRSTGTPEGHIPIENFISAPAMIGDALVGQVALANPGRDYTEQDMALVERLATLYALAVQRNQAERALQRSEALYRGIVNTMHDGVTLIEDEEVVYVSDRACEIFGYDRDTYERMTGLDFAVPEERARVREVMQAARREGVPPESLEFWIQTQAGERRYVRNRYMEIREDDEVVGRLVVTTDITEREQMRAQLRAYTEQLEQMVTEKVQELEQERAKTLQAAKLASLGEMATGVAHELNQPLTSMLFDADYLKIIAKRLLDADGQASLEELQEIHEIGQNLADDIARSRRIIDHLRAFGRVSEGHRSSVNVNDPLEDSFILVGERLRLHGIEVRRRLARDLPMVHADAHRLEQVFLNLITNAEYAMALREERDQDPEYRKVLEVTTRLEGECVVATVRDNGCGIPPALQKRIFEPFFTTKPVGEGTGLGLSISYGIVNELGGEITFESQRDEGTQFSLRFPVPEEEKRQRQETREEVEEHDAA
jgi:PAS domain S-box-containing protein